MKGREQREKYRGYMERLNGTEGRDTGWKRETREEGHVEINRGDVCPAMERRAAREADKAPMGIYVLSRLLGHVCTCALGYGNPTKVARSNQQKYTITTGSVGTFLLIAACHLSRVSVAQSTLCTIMYK